MTDAPDPDLIEDVRAAYEAGLEPEPLVERFAPELRRQGRLDELEDLLEPRERSVLRRWRRENGNDPTSGTPEGGPPSTSGTTGTSRSDGDDRTSGTSGTSTRAGEGGDWPEPVPLGPEPPKDLPPDLLPPPLREHVRSVANFAQVPAALPAGLGLAALSTALAGKVEVQVRPKWTEPANIYASVSLPPANRKSAVEHFMAEPLRNWERERAREVGPKKRAAEDKREALEKKLKSAQRKMSGAETEQEEGEALAEMEETRRRIEEMDVPRPPRLLTNDVTSEALGRLMAEQYGRAAIFSSEGDVLRIFAGKYSSGDPTLDIVKKGWSGDSVRVDRVGREGVHISDPLLTVGVTLQPALLQSVENRDVLDGEGVLGRFLWLAPPSPVGNRKTGDDVPPLDEEARSAYSDLLRRLLELGPRSVDPELDEWEPHTIGLAPDAREALHAWEEEVEGMLGPGGRLDPVEAWGGKLVGNTVRVALLLHVAYRAGWGAADPFGAPVSRTAVEAAVDISRLLVPHAHHVLAGEVGLDEDLKLARYVLRRARESEEQDLTVRRLWHLTKNKTGIDSKRDLEAVLDRLEGHNLVRVVERESSGGRPPSPLVRVHPSPRAEEYQKYQKCNSPGGDRGDPEYQKWGEATLPEYQKCEKEASNDSSDGEADSVEQGDEVTF